MKWTDKKGFCLLSILNNFKPNTWLKQDRDSDVAQTRNASINSNINKYHWLIAVTKFNARFHWNRRSSSNKTHQAQHGCKSQVCHVFDPKWEICWPRWRQRQKMSVPVIQEECIQILWKLLATSCHPMAWEGRCEAALQVLLILKCPRQ